MTEGAAAGTTVYTAAATDPAGGTVSYSLSGADAASFTINAATGVVTINAIPNYETKSSYSINVVASDGTLSSSQAVTVSVTDVAPTISSGAAGSVTEGAAAGTTVYTAAATDPAGGTVSYSLSGADAASFSINSSTGVVTINAIPNFETKPSYSINVVASDGTLSSTQAVTVSVTDVAPVISSGAAGSINEGSAAGSTVYTAAATDVAGGTVSYSLSGADAASFSINSSTGVVTINAIPNYETKSSYSINVVASDGTLSSTQAVTISVNDVAPAISSGAAGSINEGSAAGSTVYTAAATDVAGGTVSYSLSGADAGSFTVNSSTGVVTINGIPDYETKSSYSFNVVASDGTLTSSKAVTVSVTDVAPTITSSTTVTVPEGTATSTVVYTATATDPAGGTVTYSLTGADAAAFTINSSTGAVTFNASPDFETKSSYSFNVKASDPSGAFNAQAVTVTVTDVAPTITSATTVSVAEGTGTAHDRLHRDRDGSIRRHGDLRTDRRRCGGIHDQRLDGGGDFQCVAGLRDQEFVQLQREGERRLGRVQHPGGHGDDHGYAAGDHLRGDGQRDRRRRCRHDGLHRSRERCRRRHGELQPVRRGRGVVQRSIRPPAW